MRARDAGKAGDELLATRPFAACDESRGQKTAEEQPQARPDQAGLDRIFDEEDATERERHAADPDGPTCAESFFEALRGRFVGRGRRRWRRRDGGRGWG